MLHRMFRGKRQEAPNVTLFHELRDSAKQMGRV